MKKYLLFTLTLFSLLFAINVTTNAKVTTIKANKKGNYSITLYEGQKCKLSKKATKIIKKSYKKDSTNKTWLNQCLKEYKNRVFKAKKVPYNISCDFTYNKKCVSITIITKKRIKSDIKRMHKQLNNTYNELKSFSVLSESNFYKDKSLSQYSDFYAFLTKYTVDEKYTELLSKISFTSDINYNNFSVKNKKIKKIINQYNKASAEIRNIELALSRWRDDNCIWSNKYTSFSNYYEFSKLYCCIFYFEEIKSIF